MKGFDTCEIIESTHKHHNQISSDKKEKKKNTLSPFFFFEFEMTR